MSDTIRRSEAERRHWAKQEAKPSRKQWGRRNRARARQAVREGHYDRAAQDERRTCGWLTH